MPKKRKTSEPTPKPAPPTAMDGKIIAVEMIDCDRCAFAILKPSGIMCIGWTNGPKSTTVNISCDAAIATIAALRRVLGVK